MRPARTRQPGASFLLLAASLVVVVAGLRAAGPILLPLLVAVFLSILSSPLLSWLTRRHWPTPLAVVATVLANLAALGLVVALVGGSINAFTDSLPKYKARLGQQTLDATQWLQSKGLDLSRLRWFQAPPESRGEEDATEGGSLPAIFDIDATFDLVAGTVRGVAALLSNALLVLLMMTFILLEAAGLPHKLDRAFSLEAHLMVRLMKVKEEIQRYLGIKTLISLLTGLLVTLWVWLWGVDFPLLWGLVAFLLNYIPSLGSILAAIPAVLLALIELGPGRALIVALGYLVVNLAIGNFLDPYLMGRRLGLSTLVVFLSLLFWGWVWGPVGMLLSVPLTMVLKILLENTDDLRWLAALLGRNSPTVSG